MAKQKKVSVDLEEYQALCELRDGEHARVQINALRSQENYMACLAINRDQCTRLAQQDLQLTDLRSKIGAFEREITRLAAETPKR